MKVSDSHLSDIREKAESLLARNGCTLDQVTIGAQAWDILHLSGGYEAVKAGDYCDAHLQTALQAVMPNAVFRDTKRY